MIYATIALLALAGLGLVLGLCLAAREGDRKLSDYHARREPPPFL